jgi:ABC-type sulfate transport system permease component
MEQALVGGSIAGIATIAIILAIIVMVLWIFMPFVIMSMRKRMDETNRLLREINERLGDRDDRNR